MEQERSDCLSFRHHTTGGESNAWTGQVGLNVASHGRANGRCAPELHAVGELAFISTKSEIFFRYHNREAIKKGARL